MKSFLDFMGNRRGVVAATTAVLMPGFILFMALGIEVGEWFTIDRQMQTAADSAAVAAALELSNGGTVAEATTKAGWSASRNAFSGTPTINCPPALGAYKGGSCASSASTGYVEAVVIGSQPTVFANLFESSVTVGARAVASWTQPYQSCGLALAANGTDISASGAPTLTLGNGCVLASNSTAAGSLDLSLANSVSAPSLISAGGLACAATCNTSSPLVADGPLTPDPLSCSVAASFCAAVGSIPGGSCPAAVMPSPPVAGSCYGSMVFASGSTTIPAGTYYIDQGSFTVQSGATVTGSGVTIVLTSSNVAACAGNVLLQGTATLTAPNSGTFGGMLFIQVCPSGTPALTDSIAAAATVTLGGRLYAPAFQWAFDASPTTTCIAGVSPCTGSNECLTVTASVLQFAASVDLEDAGCASPSGTNLFNVAAVSLVE